MNDYQNRIARLQSLLKEQGTDLAILAGTEQMRYLTGWREGGHERFVGLFIPAEGEAAFVVPAMNAPQATLTPARIDRVLGWEDATGWHEAVRTIVEPVLHGSAGVGQVVVDDEMHSVHLLALQDQFPQARFRAIGPTMAQLRQIKTDAELDAMTRAAHLIDRIFEETLPELRVGVTETDIADVVKGLIKRHNSTPSFSPLICFGANAALPHHHTGDTALKRGDIVIIDIGCTADGYASDITRTVAFGAPTDTDAARVYEIVFQAHTAARQTAQPSVSGEEVDGAARRVITEAGFGPQFLHRTGHGIGLSCHEPPNMVAGNREPLAPGMCFSVEPGIYLSGRFGVRIENIVTVTADGVRSLNAEPSPTLRIVSA